MKKNDEQYIQIYICSFLRKLQLAEPRFLFFHVPNGGSRNKLEASNLKMAGLLPGVPDLCFIWQDKMQFVELKKNDGKLSDKQKDFIRQSRQFNFPVDIFYAETPHDAIPQFFPLMEKIGYTPQGISQASSSVLSSLA